MAAKPGAIIHGTYGGYQAHRKRSEDPCRQCTTAHNEYMRTYRASSGGRRRKDKFWNRTRAAALEQLACKHPREFTEILDGIRQQQASPV